MLKWCIGVIVFLFIDDEVMLGEVFVVVMLYVDEFVYLIVVVFDDVVEVKFFIV